MIPDKLTTQAKLGEFREDHRVPKFSKRPHPIEDKDRLDKHNRYPYSIPGDEYKDSVFQKQSARGDEGMMVDISKFLSPEAMQTLSTTGLHKIGAAMEKVANNRDVGPELNLASVVTLLGERAFIKRAEQRQIRNGILAYRKLTGA